jgi:cell division protease FtsH
MPPKTKPKFNLNWIYIAVFVGLLGLQLFSSMTPSVLPTTFKAFSKMVIQNDVQKITVINKEEVLVYLTEDALKSKEAYKKIAKKSYGEQLNPGPHYRFEMPVESFEAQLERFYASHPAWLKKHGELAISYETQSNVLGEVLSWVLPLLLFAVLWFFLLRRMGGGGGGPGGQIFNIGKSRAQVFDGDMQVKISFKDVAGMEGAKDEVLEVVDFLKNPKKYTDLGGKIPKGVLLSGPPGTGKTLLAKAVAGEAKVPFFSLSGSDFVEMFVGVGASRVRDLFRQAKEKSPSIIFIDEIDAIGRARGKNAFSGGNDERENTLNQLLTEMDGFGTNEHVIVMGATNRADILDRALMRAGRFDRLIYVDLPELNERKDIFQVHLRPLKLAPQLDVEFLARQTPGFSGADIANVCNEAALIAARKEKKFIEKQDFLDAVDRIVGGLEKKSMIITPDEKKSIAYHESGHATISWLLEHASPLVKVTIVPRGKALGAAWYLPEERHLTTSEQLLDEMCATLGGRAAEEVIFGKISTGALSDLEKVTKQARAMVTIYGLNAKLGNITYYDSSGQNEYQFDKPYSEKTAEIIDSEIHELIESQYERAKTLLLQNLDKLHALAADLMANEVIFKENMEAIFGVRPWKSKQDILDELALEADAAKAEIERSAKKSDDLSDGTGTSVDSDAPKTDAPESDANTNDADTEIPEIGTKSPENDTTN